MLRVTLSWLSLWVAVALGVAIFFVVANNVSHSFQGCVKHESAQWSPENNQQQSLDVGRFIKPQLICGVRLVDAHNGLFAAISAMLLVVVTWGLVAVGRLQIETSRNQLRAQVHLATADVINVAPLPAALPGQTLYPTNATRTNPGAGPGSIMVIKNFGQITATDVVHWANMCVREYPLASQLPAKVLQAKGVTTRMSLPPTGISQKIIQMSVLTNQEIAALRSGTKAIYVYGDIQYRDGFGRKRITNFQMFHNEFGGRVGLSGHLTGMEEGNNAT